MSEGVIPGLDGDIPSERRLLPDSLTAMRTKDGAPTVAFGGQQSAAEPGRDGARDHPPKVSFVTFVVVPFVSIHGVLPTLLISFVNWWSWLLGL